MSRNPDRAGEATGRPVRVVVGMNSGRLEDKLGDVPDGAGDLRCQSGGVSSWALPATGHRTTMVASGFSLRTDVFVVSRDKDDCVSVTEICGRLP